MNHPHEQQAAAMARAGELPDDEQLRECINSGQVSAAQVVAHADAGQYRPNSSGVFGAVRVCQISDCECSLKCGNGPCRQEIRDLPKPTGWPAGMLQDDSRQLSKALARDPNARAHAREAVAHQEAGELPPLPKPDCPNIWGGCYSADQMREAMQEAEKLRDVLWMITEHNALHFGDRHNTVIQGRAALTAPGEKHE